jgi:outer membrane protein OmpA-like peptidoglycan-associated protein
MTLALIGWADVAQAQPRGANMGMAQALFEDGRALSSQGRLELACGKLEESYRLDPAVGTLLSWADCEERRGHMATAWALWLEAASAARNAKQADREVLARGRAVRSREKLGTLSIEVPIAARLPGISISRDGVPIAPAAWGTEAPIDPGEHTIAVAAPGRRELSEKVQVTAGQAVRFQVPELVPSGAAPALEPPASAREASVATDASTEATTSASPVYLGLFRTLAWLSGAGVLVLLGVVALRARSTRSSDWAMIVTGFSGKPALALAAVALAVIGVVLALATRGAPSREPGEPVAGLGFKVIRVAGDPWSGYSTFRGEPRLAGELAKTKLRLEYVDDPALYDQDARMKALAEGKIDAAVTTIDAFLQHGAKHRVNGLYPGVIVWNIDESNGGDAIFLDKNRTGFDSVRSTDRVCYASGTPSEHLWDFASLSFANLDNLATDNGVVAADCWSKLIEGKVQIAVLWQPTTALAIKAGYPKAFSTGGQADDVIIDVLVVGRSFLAKEAAAVTALTRSYFSVIDSYLSDPVAHAAFVTKDCGPDCAGDETLGKAVLEGIDFLSYRGNMCLWWGHCDAPPKMVERIHKTARLLTAKQKLLPSDVPAPETILDDRALLELEAEMKTQLQLAADVVGKETQIATFKLEAREKTYRYLASVTQNDPARDVGTLRLPNVYFPEGSAQLDQNARSVVDVIGEELRAFPALCVHVHGYTSSSGNPDKNRQLSEARAHAIADYLWSLDNVMFQHSRFDVRGFGQAAPIMRNNAEDLNASRRTEFKLFNCEQQAVSTW